MTKSRLLVSLTALLGLAATGWCQGPMPRLVSRPVAPAANAPKSTAPSLSTPDQERSGNAAQDKSPFAKVGIFTYRPDKAGTQQVFALELEPHLPASTVQGRDYLVMMSVAATQAGEGYLASTQIVDQMIKLIGPKDRLSIWTIAAGDSTRAITSEFMNPRDERSANLLKKAQEKLRAEYPAGDTDLKAGLLKALASFDGAENRQRILLFLGDGLSTHSVLSNDERFDLARQFVEKRVAFFPVPLGLRLDPENLHGLANGTGGMVLRTTVGSEKLDDVMKRYFVAFNGPILYDAKLTLPATVKSMMPTTLPPLRSDSPTLVCGRMAPSEGGDFQFDVQGTPLGSRAPIAWHGKFDLPMPESKHYFLKNLVEQWEKAKDRPALLRADRALTLAFDRTRNAYDELMLTAEMAFDKHFYDAAGRAAAGAKLLAPTESEPDAMMRLADNAKLGKLTPEDIMKAAKQPRELEKLGFKNGKTINEKVMIALLQEKDIPAATPAPAPNGGVPAPGNMEREDQLQARRDLVIIQEQKWTEIVENSLRQARRELTQDPDGVLDNLRNILTRIRENPDLSDRVRTGLTNRLTTALREGTSQATLSKINQAALQRNAAIVRNVLEAEDQTRTLEQRQRAQLAVFRKQIELAYQDERTKADVMNGLLAMQNEARLRGQQMPLTALAMYDQVQAGFHLAQHQELRKLSERRWLETFNALDRSFIPFPDEPGVEFPKLSTWKRIYERRKDKYGTTEVNGSEQGRYEAQSVMKLLEDQIEIPDIFKVQPVPFRAVLKYLTDTLAGRGKELDFMIDKQAFKDAAPDGTDILEQPIEFPVFMKKMPIAVVLRLALSQYPGDATYLIRRNVIEITTGDRAIYDKVIRVHYVGDLVIPISQSGATTQLGSPASFSAQAPIGGVGALGIGGGVGAIGGQLGGGGFSFMPGSAQGGTAGSATGGGYLGGFNGSLGAQGGGTAMQDLITVITITIDPGNWYFVQQQSPFQTANINNFNPFAGGGGLGFGGGGGALGGGLGGALGGAGANGILPGGPPTPVGQGGPADLTNPRTNTIYPYMPVLGLIVRAQARTHTSLTGGALGGKAGMKVADAGPFGDKKVVAQADDPKNPGVKGANPIAQLAANDPNRKGGDPLKNIASIEPAVWDAVLSDGTIPPTILIATAETLFEQADKKQVVAFLKADLRRGLIVRPWVYEALAVALEATGGDPDEVRRARLSAVALDPTDAEGFLTAARTLAENGQHDRALAFCKQAAQLEPNLERSYEEALVYAEKAKDAPAMEWAAGNLLRQDWPIENQFIHLTAQTRLTSLAQSLDKEKRATDAEKLRAALDKLKERDLVINLTWETSQEPAEMELLVKESTGGTCSYEQKQTAGGGILIHGDSKSVNRISYVSAAAFDGTYDVTVRKLWGRPLFGQARLEIIRHLGTPQEDRQLEIVKIDAAKTFHIRLTGGRRTDLAVISDDNLKPRADSKAPASVNGREALRQLLRPEMSGGAGVAGGQVPEGVGQVGREETARRSSSNSAVGAGMNYEIRESADRKTTSMVMQPVFETIQAARNVNLNVVPGGGK
jgi:tetratricopeptide (TPR) repeat protein